MFLEGERTRLRPADPADAPSFQGWINDPEIARYLGTPAYQYSLAAEQAFVETKATIDWEHGVFLAIEATDGDAQRLICSIEERRLEPIARRGEIGMLIGDRTYWNRGFGSDALRTMCRFGFADLDLHRIELAVAAFNPRARRAYEKGRVRRRRAAARPPVRRGSVP